MQSNAPNLFETLKFSFTSETGLDWKKHIDTYCRYVQAKASSLNVQMLVDIRNFASQIVEKLPPKR